MTLPDFLLLGAPKAGTTALHVALSRHPSLFLSPVKEPKFFLTDGPPPRGGGPGDDETYRRYVWQREAYERLFAAAPPGRAAASRPRSTCATRPPTAASAALVPDARLVAVLRDPVDRAHSNWTHLRSAGLEPEADFLRACAREHERARAGWGPFWRYVGLGRYGEQLESLLSHVPREQVLVLLYRDVRERPVEVLDRVCAHLGVQTGLLTAMTPRNVTVQAGAGRRDELVARALRAVTSASAPAHPGAADGRRAAGPGAAAPSAHPHDRDAGRARGPAAAVRRRHRARRAAHRPRPRPLARPGERGRAGAAGRPRALRHRLRQHRPPGGLRPPGSDAPHATEHERVTWAASPL